MVFVDFRGGMDEGLTVSSPLKPAELQVLRTQYEKEGDYVGVQTKFNFAWVCLEDAGCRDPACC